MTSYYEIYSNDHVSNNLKPKSLLSFQILSLIFSFTFTLFPLTLNFFTLFIHELLILPQTLTHLNCVHIAIVLPLGTKIVEYVLNVLLAKIVLCFELVLSRQFVFQVIVFDHSLTVFVAEDEVFRVIHQILLVLYFVFESGSFVTHRLHQ